MCLTILRLNDPVHMYIIIQLWYIEYLLCITSLYKIYVIHYDTRIIVHNIEYYMYNTYMIIIIHYKQFCMMLNIYFMYTIFMWFNNVIIIIILINKSYKLYSQI